MISCCVLFETFINPEQAELDCRQCTLKLYRHSVVMFNSNTSNLIHQTQTALLIIAVMFLILFQRQFTLDHG
jgi:hypothetical protein